MGKQSEIRDIIDFVTNHRESYASLAVCRRALDQGLDRVTDPIISDLSTYLAGAPEDEIDAFYSIIS